MDDSTEDVPMTPDVIAQQNASPRTMNLQGLSLSLSPPDDASQNTAQKEKETRQLQKNKREMLAQRQQEEQERSQRQDAFYRKNPYMAALANEERQAQMKGEPMDPQAAAEIFQKAFSVLTSGFDLSSMLTDTVKEALVKGESEGQEEERNTKEDAFSARPASQ